MKYILGLAFSFEFYKKPAELRLYVGDVLIDDIRLTETIKRSREKYAVNGMKNTKQYQDTPWRYHPDRDLAKKIFLYEVDESVLTRTIRIEIKNNNNNYNNGFMTKYSYFIFDIVFLLPKKYWKDISLMAKDYSTLKDHTHGIIGPREEFARQGLADFWEWPCHDREFDEKTQEYHPGIGFGYRRGGSFDYSFELTRHRDLVVIKPKNMPQEIMDDCFWIMEPYFLSYYARLKAINISNENQRNHNA